MGWVFQWCTKQAIFYQWQGWMIAASPSEQVTQCHSNPEEVQIAIHQLSSGKAPGSDSIPGETYKEGGSVLTGKLLTFIQLILVKEQLPQDFKDASIIHIYKWKGNWHACYQSMQNLLTFNFRQDPSLSPSELPQQPSWTWTLTRESMQLP